MFERLRRRPIVDEWAIGVVPMHLCEWISAALRTAEAAPAAVRWFEWPGMGSFVADPIAFTAGDEHFVAYELFDSWKARGAIAVGALRNGSIDHLAVVLDDPAFHFAYPFIVERGGQLYCVPDCSREDGLSAFVLRSPTRWEYEGSLRGLPKLSDPTIHRSNGLWWVLGTRRQDSEERLHVYYSDDLFSEWHESASGGIPSHGDRRGAGPFVEVDGRLIRPSQDSAGRYGAAVNLNEVSSLGKDGYTERLAARVPPRPEWPYTEGMHTVSGVGEWTAVDASRRKRTNRALVQKLHARWERRRRSRRAAVKTF